jgi:hypothetical protein
MFIGHMGESYEHQGHMGATIADWIGLRGSQPPASKQPAAPQAQHSEQASTQCSPA